jgi:hypothetical protein
MQQYSTIFTGMQEQLLQVDAPSLEALKQHIAKGLREIDEVIF